MAALASDLQQSLQQRVFGGAGGSLPGLPGVPGLAAPRTRGETHQYSNT